jgi:hypothetical protein
VAAAAIARRSARGEPAGDVKAELSPGDRETALSRVVVRAHNDHSGDLAFFQKPLR